jgi:hypothetical protein
LLLPFFGFLFLLCFGLILFYFLGLSTGAFFDTEEAELVVNLLLLKLFSSFFTRNTMHETVTTTIQWMGRLAAAFCDVPASLKVDTCTPPPPLGGVGAVTSALPHGLAGAGASCDTGKPFLSHPAFSCILVVSSQSCPVG